MKRSMAALAVLGTVCTSAFAQSNVTIYGIVDMAVVRESGGAAGSGTRWKAIR